MKSMYPSVIAPTKPYAPLDHTLSSRDRTSSRDRASSSRDHAPTSRDRASSSRDHAPSSHDQLSSCDSTNSARASVLSSRIHAPSSRDSTKQHVTSPSSSDVQMTPTATSTSHQVDDKENDDVDGSDVRAADVGGGVIRTAEATLKPARRAQSRPALPHPSTKPTHLIDPIGMSSISLTRRLHYISKYVFFISTHFFKSISLIHSTSSPIQHYCSIL